MKKIILIWVNVFVLLNAFAQTENKELAMLVKNSFSYFPKFKELEQAVVIGEAKIDLINVGRSPIVNSNAGINYVAPVNEFSFGGPSIKINPNLNYNTNVSGSYVLYDFGAVKQNVEKAKIELQSTKHNIDAAKAQIAYQIATIYYGIIYTKNAIKIQDTVLAFLYETQKDIRVKIKLGVALEFDNLTIQATIDQELNKKVDVENMLQKQINLLQYFSGINVVNDIKFDFGNNTKNANEFLSQAQAQNIDYILQKDKIKLTEAEKKITALQNKPAIVINGATGFRNGFVPSLYQFRFNYLAGVGVTMPIYNGGRMKKNMQLNESVLKLQTLTLNSMDSSFKKDYNQINIDIASAKQRIQNVEGQVVQANAAKNLAQIRFKNGIGTNLELLNAITNIQKAAASKLQYEYQLCLANVEMAKLGGVVFW
jgi:outer membrane protein